MYTIFEVTPEFETINSDTKALIAELFSNVEIRNQRILLAAQKNVYQSSGQRGSLYVIQEGVVRCGSGDRTLYFYDSGDLIGLQEFSSNLNEKLDTDFAVVANEYRITELFSTIKDGTLNHIWHKILANHLELLHHMLLYCAEKKLEINPETATIEAGSIIIEQGSMGSDVYTLVEGHLEVIVDKICVGEVLPDEIFGAMAALTGTPRSATVRATELSVILTLPRERFLDLMSSRPHTVLKMIEDMSRTIVALNDKIVGMSTL